MTRRSLAALLIACALLFAACGDDGGSSAGDTTTQAADEGSSDGGPAEDDGGGAAGDIDVDSVFSGECTEAVQAFNAALASAGTAITGGVDGAVTPEATVEQLKAVAEAAPDEIKDDFAVLADAYAEFAQALADAGLDFNDPNSFSDPEAIAALQSIGEIFSEAELEAASGNIEAWFDANCGPA